MNLLRNEYVQWTGTDEKGEYSHIGQVVSSSEERIEFVTKEGTMNVPITDGHFRRISRPQNWNMKLPDAPKESVVTTHVKPTTAKKIVPPPAKIGSKKEKALDFYTLMMDNGIHPQRKDVIAKFIAELDMTKAGASTYQAMCKKAHL